MRKLVLIIAFVYLYQGLYYTKTEVVSQYPLLYEKLVAAGIRYPAAVFAQAAHETGGFSSAIYYENKNLWGLKVPYHRPTLALGWHRGHAKFASYDDCIREYKAWQDKYLPRYERTFGGVATNEKYVRFLKYSGFAEDPAYDKRVLHYVKLVERLIPPDSLIVRGEIKTR